MGWFTREKQNRFICITKPLFPVYLISAMTRINPHHRCSQRNTYLFYMLILYQDTFFLKESLHQILQLFKNGLSSTTLPTLPLFSLLAWRALFLERITPALGSVPISWLDFIKYSRALWKGSRGSASGCGSQNLSCMRIQNSNFSLICCKPGGALDLPELRGCTALVYIYMGAKLI